MRVNSIIIDDFYSNPEEVREFALQQEFFVEGNFPGHRTKSFLSDGIKETIQDILRPCMENIRSLAKIPKKIWPLTKIPENSCWFVGKFVELETGNLTKNTCTYTKKNP